MGNPRTTELSANDQPIMGEADEVDVNLGRHPSPGKGKNAEDR